MKSLEIVLSGVVRKISATKSNEVVNDCVSVLNCAVGPSPYVRFIIES